MERGWRVENGHILFDMLRVAIWLAVKEKRIIERRDEERKTTGTSFLTRKSLVDEERQNEKEEEEGDQDV